MIKAVIYDMDGLIIDSEPLWRKAEIEIFSKVGVPLTEAMCFQTMGQRLDEVVAYWFHKYPWKGTSLKEIHDAILDRVIKLIKEEAELKEGVIASLNMLQKANYRMALASSSSMQLIDSVLDKFELRTYFETIHSAEFEKYGKPHPDIYITTANELDIQPQYCLAIEDSINGIIAAKAAKMKCIAVPEKDMLKDKRLGIADSILPSLAQLTKDTIHMIT